MSSWLSEFSSPVDQLNVEGLQIQTPKETPLFKNALPATGEGVMRGGVGVARATQLAGSLVPLFQDKLWGLDPFDENSAYSQYMQFTDPTLTNAEQAWTLDPEDDTGAIGQVGYGLGRIAIPLTLGGGNPTPLIASETTIGAQDALAHGATSAQAVGIGVTQGAVAGLGFKMPAAVGKTAAQRVASGVGINVGLGIGARGVQSGIADDNKELAEVYDPFNPTYLATDALMGGTFGAIAAYAARRRALPISERDAITDTEIQHNSNSLAGSDITSPNAANQHSRILDSVQEALRTGQPVNVPHNAPVVPNPVSIPSLPGQASRIATDAQQAGINPQTALVISHIETGGTFSPKAQNPTSSANGLFQVIDSSWKKFSGGNRADIGEQIRVGLAHMKEVSGALRNALKREPVLHEEYMGHLLGPGGASKVLTADPNARLYDVVLSYAPGKTAAAKAKYAQAVVNNNGMKDLTVGQAIDKWKTKTEQVQAKIGNQPEAMPARTSPEDTPETMSVRNDELLPVENLPERANTSRTDNFNDWFGQDIEPVTYYHGTPRDWSAWDAEHGGGLIHLTDDPDVAYNYSQGPGGGRGAGSGNFIDTAGHIYELQPEGTFVNKSTGEQVPARTVQELYNDGDLLPHNADAVVKPLYTNIKNPLDLTTPEGIRVLSEIQATTPHGAAVVNHAKNGDFNWSSTKHERINRHWQKDLVPKIKALGYDGLRFSDDGHKTLSAFDASQIKSANKNTGGFSRDNPDIYDTGYAPKQPETVADPATSTPKNTEDAQAQEIIDTAEAIPDLLIPTGQIDAEGNPIMLSAAELAEQIRTDRNIAEEQIKAGEAAVACAIRNGV